LKNRDFQLQKRQYASEAVYPPIVAADGKPMNAMFDYEFVMTAEELPPVNATVVSASTFF